MELITARSWCRSPDHTCYPVNGYCGDTCIDSAVDPANCGGCGVICGGSTACVAGRCECPTATPAVCGGRCVDLASDVENCGRCDNGCTAAAPALPACRAGTCALDCSAAAGRDDCDGDAATGCETDLGGDPMNCGECGRRCDFTNAMGTCTAGTCRVDRCRPGYGDCDADGLNGCEANLGVDVDHCSACGARCAAANGTARCAASACEIATCNAGYEDCNLDVDDGCEADTRIDPRHCSECGRACPGSGRPNTVAGCAAAACTVACAAGFGDCDADTVNGCETAVSASTSDCGRCGNVCGASEVCRGGMCITPRFTGATASAWENLGRMGVPYPGFSDYSPAGVDAFYARSSAAAPRFARFDVAGSAWAPLAEGTVDSDDAFFAGPAWAGSALFVIVSGSVRRFDIAAGTWSVPLTGIVPTRWSQATTDGAGHVYAITPDGRLATYDIAANTISYRVLGAAAVGPRIAWDALSRQLYVVPSIETTTLLAVPPGTGAPTVLRSLPASHFTPAFCSDRSGHLYAAADTTGSDIWQYDVATDTWRTLAARLPFDHNANGACTVTDAGYLYLTDTGDQLARLALL